MPFTPPTTYYSQGNSGYLGQLGYGSPSIYILEIKSINNPRFTVPKLNRTHLLSVAATEEYTPGLIDPGALDLAGNYIGDPTQTSDIDTLVQNQTVFYWTYTMPVQNRSKTMTATGSGFWTKFDIGPIEGNRVIEFSAQLQITGWETITVA